jgi:glucosyl-3-phosphoglycerate synthase
MARPLLNAFYPDLAGVVQPLAGEIAARRELLERLPFVTGYGVDIALLIDAWAEVGLAGMAQVDLDVRQNRHRPLAELSHMAAAVLRAVTDRLERDGRLGPGTAAEFVSPVGGRLEVHSVSPVERPPARTLAPVTGAASR